MKLSVTIFHRLMFAVAVIFSIYSVVDAQTKLPPIKQVSAGIVNGKATSLPKPEYPDDARKAKLSGSVNVQVLIDEAGKVVSAKAVSGLENVSLRIAAENAALKATFSPTLLNGHAVKVSGVIVYNFVAERSLEDQLKFMGVSTILTLVRPFASDLDKLKEIFGEKELFEDMPDPEGFPELNTLRSIEKLSVDKRLDAIDAALSSVRSKVTGSDQWQFEVGKNLGELLGSMMWTMSSAVEPGDLTKLDKASVRLSLNKIRDLTLSAPPDFPQSVLGKLKEITAVGDKEPFLTRENIQELCEKLEALFELISPDSTK